MTDDTPITTIEVVGYEWVDKVNGNLYCSARAYVNGDLAAVVPFGYGYGDAYLQYATEALHESGRIAPKRSSFGGLEPLWQYCQDNGVELRSKVSDAPKREVIAWGTEEG